MARQAPEHPGTATGAPELDAARYKAAQQREWDAAAPGWRRWWERMERAVGPVGDRLVDLAGISGGDRVLDVATGIGEPALTAARRVGHTGQVTATDISPGMIEIARERAQTGGLENVEFRTADAEELEFPDASFDAVVCRFGLMFLPDVGGVLARIRHALAAGRGFAAAVWGPPERVPLLSLPMRAVADELSLPPPQPGAPGLFALGDGGRLRDLMEEAGFKDVRTETVTVAVDLGSAEEYAEFVRETVGAVTEMMRGEPPERQERGWASVAEAARRHADGDGSVRLPGEAILVAGRRPHRTLR